jgi:hypothetical protein
VRYGGPEVRRHAEVTVDGARRKAQESLAGLAPSRPPAEQPPAARPAPRPAPAPEPAPGPAAANGDAAAAERAALPIPGYDQLSASQVVARLEGLGPDELHTIRAYESEHRGRNTILGKIAQLTT